MDMNEERLPQSPHLYNGLTLAYMGDAVYEVYVRQHLLHLGKTKVGSLHRQATKYVSAKAQAHILQQLEQKNLLRDGEQDVVRRGRNAHSATIPKHTDVHTYRLSTALESLIGYLYLEEQNERLWEMMREVFRIVEGHD